MKHPVFESTRSSNLSFDETHLGATRIALRAERCFALRFMASMHAPRIRALRFLALFSLSLVASIFLQAADSDIVINEIMYHPPNDLENLQYVELYNRGKAAVDVSNWSFTKGVRFVIPEKTKIEPDSYLVICRNAAEFAKHYGREMATLGNFTGKLSHKGDRVEISNSQKQVVDWVKYADGGDWPSGPDGYSPSLERICPFAPAQAAVNWASSKMPNAKKSAGTPGKKNDNFSASLPPAISKMEIFPKIPAAGQSVNISVLAASSNRVQSVALMFRSVSVRNESNEQSIPMKRVAGDEKSGKYSATIEGQPGGQLVRFRIKAIDADGVERIEPSANEPRPTHSVYTLGVTNTARVPFGFIFHEGPTAPSGNSFRFGPRGGQPVSTPTRGNATFVYVPPAGGEVQVFDHIRVTPRHGGLKVRFMKDQMLHGISVANIIFEGPPRWILAEPLAYELYRLAGVPAELTEHIRLWKDGRPMGYQLLIEQPNKSFIARNKRDDSGNLYKLLWYGQGVVGQHEKKTHLSGGHADLIELIENLRRKQGLDQWEFIQKNFNVDEVINYFAVNMCISNWDGFFNNYFTYHDVNGTGKWEMYPWDEDKTWGDYDGASPRYDWYEMPLSFGMNGDQASRNWRGFFGGGPFGGTSWWRPPGFFSGPLLANMEFRKRFLARLREVCTTVFTEEKTGPIIRGMESRVAPEIPIRAGLMGEDSQQAIASFKRHIQSFTAQVENRRKFILSELGKEKP